jgi:manganese transport protein
MLGIPPQISVPLIFVVHVILVYNRKYAHAEKPLLVISIFFAVAWAAAAFLTARNGIQVTPWYFSTSPDFFFLLAANVGAVIMPFMLFYQASATAEKGTTAKNLKAVRFETAVGAIVSELIMIAIAVAAIGVRAGSVDFAAPKVLSQGLSSVSGFFAPYLFGIGLIAASFIALIVISLGSCWGVTEAVGWGRKNWFRVYLVESLPALVVPLVTLDLVNLALSLMVLQIVVLLAPAVTLGLIASSRRLMGRFSLNGFNKILYWVFLALIFATGIASLVYSL